MNPLQFLLFGADANRQGPEEVDEFARRTGWIDDTAVISRDTTVIEIQPLLWWDDVELIVAHDPAWEDQHGFENSTGAWLRDEYLHRLDGTSPPIHAMNAQKSPDFNEQNVLDYLRFFCYFVHGEAGGGGPFAIVESTKDSIVPQNPPQKMVDLMPRPAQLLKHDEQGYHCEAFVWYSENLFLANFIVRENGMVEMLDDEQLVAELGISSRFNLRFR